MHTNNHVMNLRSITIAAALALGATACTPDAAPEATKTTGDYAAQVWVLQAAAGSASPDLSIAPDGHLLLSWMNQQTGRRTALQFGAYSEDAGWQSQARTIAVGNSLKSSWADGQHLRATPDGALWAQWLQATTAEGGSAHAREVILARSRDGGMTWTQMTRVSPEASAAEHGFAALWPVGSNALGVAWLDGAEPTDAAEHGHAMTDDEHAEHSEHHGGATLPTVLHATEYNMDLQRGTVQNIDTLACDCCRTDVAMTARGPLLVWRDRSEKEVRDIASARFENAAWTPPKLVHADGWTIDGCPMNGPAVAADGEVAVTAWYTEAGGTPQVQLARSSDAGDHFATPVAVDQGAAVFGQVAVALTAQQVWVSWLREDASGQTLMLARYAPDLSKRLQTLEVAKLAAKGHASGLPQLVANASGAWLVWTDVSNGAPHLKGAHVTR